MPLPHDSSTHFAFTSPDAVGEMLASRGYVSSPGIEATVHLAGNLGKPVLVEGPAGTGKTALAKAISEAGDARLIRLQCYEGLDESKALYEWDYRKQLLHIQATRSDIADTDTSGIFGEEFLLTRPLLEAIRSEEPVVLLIDEVDRLDIETEALLLEILSEFQVSIPELGTITARQRPLVILTSNATRDLSEALKRRCLYLHIGYPTRDREREIIELAVPGLDAAIAEQVADVVRTLRALDLKKAPSVSESLDWARALLLRGKTAVDTATVLADLGILLKYQQDIDLATAELEGQSA